MSTPPQVVPIFATPFAVVKLEAAEVLNPKLAALFADRATPEWRDSSAPTPHVFRSRDDLTDWHEDTVRAALREILAGVTSVAASISSLSAEQFAGLSVEARAWFTIVEADGCVPPASYANASWVAVYCVEAPPPTPVRFDSGVLRLYEPRHGNVFQDVSQSSMRLPYLSGHCTWRPVPGEMAVYPAAVIHEIALLRAPGRLVIVSARVRFVGSEQAWMPPW